jgi:hypothetical protein
MQIEQKPTQNRTWTLVAAYTYDFVCDLLQKVSRVKKCDRFFLKRFGRWFYVYEFEYDSVYDFIHNLHASQIGI